VSVSQSQVFETNSEDETIELGRTIAATLPRRAVVLLIGNLGAGKTTLGKGIVSGLGAASPDDVSSPTFTLIHEYGLSSRDDQLLAKGVPVFHIDLYRLDRPREVATLGLDDLFDRDGVVLIEWGERFPELIPSEHIEIRIETLAEARRRFTVETYLST